ncbi:hypothetical protein LZD49_28380 [Dyadobacter sp. CY261]|uniref:hypothetical protein n=1 Tax=Dyadobacter sp. CY261 TaxID=2907203 RepID=UPI001F2E703C|nr:hypothetical protein [Dyadobacter sp. CY261]MCF0074435.1 hypothetical protein [Dyadobacter sp. CY261]
MMSTKKTKILARYYLNRLRKKIPWSMLLYALSIFLFLSILIPNFMKRLPIIGNWERIYTLTATIARKSVKQPKGDIIVEIGGHKVKSKIGDAFTLKFPSRHSKNIPMLIITKDTTFFERISFDNEYLLDTTLLLDHKYIENTKN